jgi:2,3-bisphosphoglycerate-independent phosphoglycerate mutase
VKKPGFFSLPLIFAPICFTIWFHVLSRFSGLRSATVKYCIIVPDGMADWPIAELGDKTPLDVARKPNMDYIAQNGRLGLVRTIPPGMSPGSDVACLSVIGYDPRKSYTGRAPLEAASMGLPMTPGHWFFRCNLVTVDAGLMADYCAGHISTREADELVKSLQEKLAPRFVTFHTGVSFRQIMVYAGPEAMDGETTPPHDITGKKFMDYLPRGNGSQLLQRLMLASRELLSAHPVNAVRVDLKENPANMIWLWGQGQAPRLPNFADRYRKTGAVISAVDLVKGIGRCIGWDVIEVAGATGELDTNYAGKAQRAIEALESHDIVFIHVEAPDSAGHDGDAKGKVQAIERVDAEIVGPLLEALKACGKFRILVMPDHLTPLAKRTHVPDPVPFALYGESVRSSRQLTLTEANAQESDLKIEEGHTLMQFFLEMGRREGEVVRKSR